MHPINNQADQHQPLSIDQALVKVGDEGFYQKSMILYFTICWAWMSTMYSMTAFLFYVPNFQCGTHTCTEQNGGCVHKIISPDSTINSITKQFKLYCDQSAINQRDFGIGLATLGAVVGSVLVNVISYNRKILYIICLILSQIGALMISFSQSLELVYLGIFISGLGSNQLCCLQFTILSEQTSEKYRNFSAAGVQLGWSLFSIVAVFIAKAVRDWQLYFTYIFMIPSFVLMVPLAFMQDSPKFAYLTDKQRSVSLLNKIAFFNRKSKIDESELEDNSQNLEIMKEKENYFIYDLFRYRSVRKYTLQCSFLYFIVQMQYFGSVLTLQYINDDIFIQIIYGSILDTISNTFCALYAQHFRRQRVLTLNCSIIVVSQLSCLFVSNSSYQMVINLIARAVSTLSCDFLILYVEEIFPTCIKNFGIGFYFAVGLAGGVVSPYIVTISNQVSISPVGAFGVIGIIGLVISLFLEETLNKPMKMNIPELENKSNQYHKLSEQQ